MHERNGMNIIYTQYHSFENIGQVIALRLT